MMLMLLITGIVIFILIYLAWLILPGPQAHKLPPFNPIPPTRITIADENDVLIPPVPLFTNTIFTDDYPSVESGTVIYADLEIITIGDTQGLVTVYDLQAIQGNNTSIFSSFSGTAGVRPIEVYYFEQNQDSLDKIVININNDTFIRPGYNYIMYFTVAIASEQVNYSTLYDGTVYQYSTFFDTTFDNTGAIKGSIINPRNSSIRDTTTVRERLLSVFNSTKTTRQSYQLISVSITTNVPLNIDTEILEEFNTTGRIITVTGRTEFIPSAPCQ